MAIEKCVAMQMGSDITSQATNRREGGLTSCRGRSQQFRTFT
jgi:hypothetical protein